MPLPSLDRFFEILLGITLAAVALVPLGLAVGGPFLWGGAYAWPWALLGSIGSAATFVWCARTAWHLISGRPRRDGGLLSSWLIIVAGIVAATGVVWGLSQFGLSWIGGALYLGSGLVGCFALARRRFAKRTADKRSAI